MNYIQQLNGFYNFLPINPLSSNAICLYHVLLHINNKCMWIKEFTVANLTIQSLSGLSRQQLDRARNELIQKHFIWYKKGKGNQAGKYLIVSFDTQIETQGNTQNNIQMLQTINILNKQKQNKDNKKEIKKERGKNGNALSDNVEKYRGVDLSKNRAT